MNKNVLAAAFVISGTLVMGPNAVFAGGAHSSGHSDNASVGQAGEAGHVDRQIEVEMGEMYFSSKGIDIQKGETIRFIVTNSGEFVHEFNIGTAEMHHAHAKEMTMMMDSGVLEADRINHDMMNQGEMAHSDPNSVLLEPGQTAEIIWTFKGDAALEVSCNVPGHRESGMLEAINIVKPELGTKKKLGS
jgi:uncharacterized cupredoxin-like copper-binding protein